MTIQANMSELQRDRQAARLAAEFNNLDDAAKDDFNHLVLNPGENQIDIAGDGWKPLTMREIRAPRPPIEYVVEGIFKKPSLNIVYGPPACMKTFLLQDLGICVAIGQPWLMPAPFNKGGKSIQTLQGPVVWIDYDMGEDLLVERFAALGNHYEPPDEIPLNVYAMPSPGLDASDAASVANLAARAMSAQVIIIDNLGTVSGGIEENSSGMIEVMKNLRWLAEITRACVIVIHHQRKTINSGGKTRSGDALRGHSSIEAAIDIALQVDREPYGNEITIKSTKTRTRDIAPFTAVFTYENNNDGELETAAFYSVAAIDFESDHAIEREIKAVLKGGPKNQTALWQAVKAELPDVGKNRIVDRIRQMENDKALEVSIGKYNTLIYSLPGLPVSQGFPGLPGKHDPMDLE